MRAAVLRDIYKFSLGEQKTFPSSWPKKAGLNDETANSFEMYIVRKL